MKLYKCHKEVTATPMNRLEYNKYRNWELPEEENGADEGYLFQYIHSDTFNHRDHKGYISWSPKQEFDAGYTEVKETHFIDRLIEEQADLSNRIDKLTSFIYDEPTNDAVYGSFAGLQLWDQALLSKQLITMGSLKRIIDSRVERLVKQLNLLILLHNCNIPSLDLI